MLDADVKAQLKAYLERLVQPIELVANVDDSEGSRDMMDLLRDVAEQSSMIVLTEQRDTAERAPSFLIRRTGADVSVRFAAIPTGHEFTSLVLALLQVGGYAPKLEADVIEQIRNIEGDFRFETYMSLTCQNCPDDCWNSWTSWGDYAACPSCSADATIARTRTRGSTNTCKGSSQGDESTTDRKSFEEGNSK